VALYLLVMVAIRRRRDSQGTQWTYELETVVLVGAVSPEAAIRRIEHRALGHRLEDVMNKFFDEFDNKLVNFEALLADCRESLESVREVAAQFPVERKAREDKATLGAREKLDELRSDLKRLSAYLEKLGKKKSDHRVATAFHGLVAKRDAYEERVQTVRFSFEGLVKEASRASS
jgi:hypothetical protein